MRQRLRLRFQCWSNRHVSELRTGAACSISEALLPEINPSFWVLVSSSAVIDGQDTQSLQSILGPAAPNGVQPAAHPLIAAFCRCQNNGPPSQRLERWAHGWIDGLDAGRFGSGRCVLEGLEQSGGGIDELCHHRIPLIVSSATGLIQKISEIGSLLIDFVERLLSLRSFRRIQARQTVLKKLFDSISLAIQTIEGITHRADSLLSLLDPIIAKRRQELSGISFDRHLRI